MKAVQIVCWLAACIIIVVSVAVFAFEFGGGDDAHALPPSVSIDAIFDAAAVAPWQSRFGEDEMLIAAKLCKLDEASRLTLLQNLLNSSVLVAIGLAPSVSDMCLDAAVVLKAGLVSAADLERVPRAELLSHVSKLKQLQFGNTDEADLRAIIAALHGGGKGPFERNVFLDIGALRGKAIVAACSQVSADGRDAYIFDECVGVEPAKDRVELAAELLDSVTGAVAAAGRPAVAERLKKTIKLVLGDIKSALVAAREVPRATHIYNFNSMGALSLDNTLSEAIARNARRGTRVAIHEFDHHAWPSDKFRRVAHYASSKTSVSVTILEFLGDTLESF
jgi:hypothetical protein